MLCTTGIKNECFGFNLMGVQTPPLSAKIMTQELCARLQQLPIRESSAGSAVQPKDQDGKDYSEDTTGGSTGDSGFGEARIILKVPLPGKQLAMLERRYNIWP